MWLFRNYGKLSMAWLSVGTKFGEVIGGQEAMCPGLGRA